MRLSSEEVVTPVTPLPEESDSSSFNCDVRTARSNDNDYNRRGDGRGRGRGGGRGGRLWSRGGREGGKRI